MENSMCTLSGKEAETLECIYFNCNIVKNFLEVIKKYISLNFDNTFLLHLLTIALMLILMNYS